MNLSENIDLSEPNFQSQHATKCDLLIKITNNNFSFAIVDQMHDQVKALFDADFNSHAELTVILENPLFNHFFRKIKIAIYTDKFSFIPSEVFSDSNVSAYAALINKTDDEKLIVSTIKGIHVKNIFSINAVLYGLLLTRFPAGIFLSQVDPLVASALKTVFKPMETQLLLNINANVFEAMVLKGKSLLFYNIFTRENADEFNYYLLFIIQQLALDPQKTPITISGKLTDADEIYQRVNKYFITISFAQTSKFINFPQLFEHIPAHRYFSLFGLNVCE